MLAKELSGAVSPQAILQLLVMHGLVPTDCLCLQKAVTFSKTAGATLDIELGGFKPTTPTLVFPNGETLTGDLSIARSDFADFLLSFAGFFCSVLLSFCSRLLAVWADSYVAREHS